jgi:8-oxo-dGTP diphosphatase
MTMTSEATLAPFTPLTTERLTLRAYRDSDAPELHRLLSDWEVARRLYSVKYPYSRDKADAWVESARAQLAAGTAYHLAITGQEGEAETLVGGVGVRVDPPQRRARLSYWVGRRFWGHGVAREAAGRMARWAMANLDIDALDATVATDNAGSIAVLRRIGFRQVGEGSEIFHDHATHKVLHFEATRADLSGEAPVLEGARPIVLVAACALIDTDGRILLARRPEGKKMAGLWEFPGGKLQDGETPEAALIRELHEELGIDVASNCLAPFAFASHAYDSFHLLMPLYLCRRWKGTPQSREGQALAWVRPERLADYAMPEADRPLVPLLRDFL